jgi:hypothetical protein
MTVFDTSAREAEMASVLSSAMVASPEFLRRLLLRVDAHQPEVTDGIDVRVEYTPAASHKRFDIWVGREDPKLSLVFELKRDEGGVKKEQLVEYLAILKLIQEDRSLRPRRGAPKYAKLVVVTGATESPAAVSEISAAAGGKLAGHVVWVSWYELMDLVEDLPEKDKENPIVQQLSRRLSEQGYVSYADAIPRLRRQERLLSRIADLAGSDAPDDDLSVLEATLGRMEYQMAKKGFGVSVHVTVKGRQRRTLVRQRTIKLGTPLSVFGTGIRTLGRTFLPNGDIRAFEQASIRTRKQESGVGIAFSVHSRGWVAYIRNRRGSPLPDGFVESFSSNDREPLDFSVEGVHGWLLKGRQKQPEVTARFLERVWSTYLDQLGGQ